MSETVSPELQPMLAAIDRDPAKELPVWALCDRMQEIGDPRAEGLLTLLRAKPKLRPLYVKRADVFAWKSRRYVIRESAHALPDSRCFCLVPIHASMRSGQPHYFYAWASDAWLDAAAAWDRTLVGSYAAENASFAGPALFRPSDLTEPRSGCQHLSIADLQQRFGTYVDNDCAKCARLTDRLIIAQECRPEWFVSNSYVRTIFTREGFDQFERTADIDRGGPGGSLQVFRAGRRLRRSFAGPAEVTAKDRQRSLWMCRFMELFDPPSLDAITAPGQMPRSTGQLRRSLPSFTQEKSNG